MICLCYMKLAYVNKGAVMVIIGPFEVYCMDVANMVV